MQGIPNHRHSKGRLRHSHTHDVGHKLIVEVDPGIVQLARGLLPKNIPLKPQRYAPHITVLRGEPVLPSNVIWGIYEEAEIDFIYDADACWDDDYYWLRVYCPWLQWLRTELGLPETSEQSRPPGGEHCFHITIGNTKP